MDSIVKQKKLLDSLRAEYNFLKNAPNEYKWKYEANREIYFKREESILKENRYTLIGSLGLVGIIVLQFFHLK